jgi:hypothetical protein
MPPLGGPGPRRVNAGAVKRRQRNLARIPKVVPKSAGPPVFPRYVPPRPAAIPVRRPTATQIRQARAQEQGYKSQAGAVRRVAKTQATLGPGKAVRPEGRILRRRDIAPLAQEQAYRSLGEAVEKAAIQREAHGTIRYRGHDIPAAMLSTNPEVLKAAGFKAPGTLEKAVSSPKYAIKALSNAPADIKDIAITTPSSLYHLGETAATHPKRVPGMLIEPYKQFAKDPLKFATERPVSTALMFSPTVKVPGLALGRAARFAGKQTLERPAATLPGTTLRQARTGSRDVLKRSRQAREDAAAPAPRISDKEVHRRVDEFYDAAQLKRQQMVSSAARDVNREAKRLPKAERGDLIESRLSGATGSAHLHTQRQFAREFGSHWHVGPGGTVLKPKQAPEGSGVIHATKADAERVADAITRAGHFEPVVKAIEGETEGVTGGYAVVPKAAEQRLGHHGRVGTSQATGAVAMRTLTRQFRGAVLPTSTKWLGGQVIEALVRAGAHGAGPTSYLRGRRLLRAMDDESLRQRTTGGGQFGVTGPSGEFARRPKTLAEDFTGTGLEGLAEKATKAGSLPGARHVRRGYRAYTNVVFNHVNARWEEMAKTAMLGKAVKDGPLMQRSFVGLGDKAIGEAAEGLKGTSAQVELGRQLDRAYGKYSKWGPHARETMAHSTPFIPWFINMGKFIGDVLPKDHPIKTALTADIDAASEEWRKQHRLSYRGKDHVPDFMMGSVPAGKKFVQIGRYTPFAPGEYASALGGQFLPALQSPQLNLTGVDWTGKEIKGASQERLAALAALSGAEALIPGVGIANRTTGLGEHYLAGKTKKPSVVQGKDAAQALADMLNPIRPIGEPSRGKRKAKRVRAIPLGGAGRGVIPLSGGRRKIPL